MRSRSAVAVFPVPVDPTDQSIQTLHKMLTAFEDAALDTRSVSRCVQLHERLVEMAQLIEAVDGTVLARKAVLERVA